MNELEYKRILIFAKKDPFQVLQMRWPLGSKSPMHDHGVSEGIIIVIKGKLFQKLYDFKTKKFIKKTTHEKYAIIHEYPATIHVMGNAGRGTAISLHVYSPPLDNCCIYDLKRGKVRIKMLNLKELSEDFYTL